MNKEDCAEYNTCRKYNEGDLYCEDCDNFKPEFLLAMHFPRERMGESKIE